MFSVDSLLSFPSRTGGTAYSVWTPSCPFHPGQEGLHVQCGLPPVLSIQDRRDCMFSVDSLLSFPSRTRETVRCGLPPVLSIQDKRDCSVWTPSCPFHPGQEGLFSVDSLLSFPSRTRETVQCGLPPVLSIQDKRDCSVWTPSCPFHPGQERLFSVDSLLSFPSRTGGTVQCGLPPVLSIQDRRDCSVWTPPCPFHPGQEHTIFAATVVCLCTLLYMILVLISKGIFEGGSHLSPLYEPLKYTTGLAISRLLCTFTGGFLFCSWVNIYPPCTILVHSITS